MFAPRRSAVTVVLAGALPALAALSACSLFLDSGGLTGGASDGEAGSAGGDATGGSSSGTASSSSSSSSASSASSSGDSSASLCAGTSLFCSTFDDLADVSSFTKMTVQGSLSIDPANFMSPPHGLLVEAQPTATLAADVGIDLRLGPTPTSLHVEYDVRVLERTDNQYAETTMIITDDSGQTCAFFLAMTDQWQYGAGCPVTDQVSIGAITLNTWDHVEWDVNGATGTLKFKGGTYPLSFGNGGLKGALRVVHGVYYVGEGGQPIRLATDNLLVR